MTAMTLPTRKKLIGAVVVLVVLALIGLLAWTALRGGRASVEGSTVREIVQDDLVAEFSDTLEVSEEEVTALYSEEKLEETAEKAGVSRDELLQGAREVVVDALQQAVDDGEIDAEQADRALSMTMKAITNHL